jgi:FAD:protein FMN transferase
MGTDVEVLGPAVGTFDRALAVVRRRFRVDDGRYSRFRRDSELSRINRRAGRWTPVSSELEAVLSYALEAARRTDGLVDPTVLRALEAVGYDRDFDEVLAGARGRLHPPAPCGRWRDTILRDGRVLLPTGVGIDLGGLAKGWTVDRAAHEAIGTGLRWVTVNAGGDLRVLGDAPPVTVAVEDPDDPDASLLELRLRTGAIATSSVAKRSWGPGAHHLIDPRTGRPVDGDVVQATVWAPRAVNAEVLAKELVLRGDPTPAEHGAVVVSHGGDVIVTFDIADAIDEAPMPRDRPNDRIAA